MKRITCEMCGSTDLVKKDGLFECQSCGTKYSVEEAKKMMVEGTVNVEGTVKIDDTNKINNLIKNAKTLFKDGKTDESYKLFGDVLNIDTENYIAITYRGLCSAWHSSIADPKIGDAVNGISRGFEIAKKELGETADYAKFCMEILGEMGKISVACMNLYRKHYLDAHNNYMEATNSLMSSLKRSGMYADTDWYKKRHEQEDTKRKRSQNTAIEGIHLTLVASNVVAVKITSIKDISIFSVKDYEKIKEYVISYMKVPTEFLNKELDDYKIGLGLMVDLDRKVEKLGKIERDNYFKENPEEKEKLENELSSSKKQIKELHKNIEANKKEIESINKEISNEVKPLIKQLNKIADEMVSLQEEKSNLGLFKGKEKKAIQEKIDEKEAESDKLSKKIIATREKLAKDKENELSKLEKSNEKDKKEIEKLIKNIEMVSEKLFGEPDDTSAMKYEEEEKEHFNCNRCGAEFIGDLDECPECGTEFE